MTNNQNPNLLTQKKKCEHKKTYVAVRHVTGLRLVKCSDCQSTVFCG